MSKKTWWMPKKKQKRQKGVKGWTYKYRRKQAFIGSSSQGYISVVLCAKYYF